MKTLIFLFTFVLTSIFAEESKPLAGVTIVIDPGHGGKDSGAFKKLPDGVLLCENEQVFDIACRLRQLLLAQGAKVTMTIKDPKSSWSVSDANTIQPKKTAVFNDKEGKIVEAGKSGLTHRLTIAKSAAEKGALTIYVSLHFDSTSGDVVGPSVIAPPLPGSDALAQAIAKALSDSGRKRNGSNGAMDMVVRSGDKKGHGLRNLFILRADKNPIKNRVLVEYGNIQNKDDAWRIRDPKVRQSYAELTAKGIVSFITARPKKD